MAKTVAQSAAAGAATPALTASVDDWFERTRGTPPAKRATDPFAHQIFVSDSVGAARVRCDAAERKRLKTVEAQRRWDFFHRPDRALIDALDAEALAALGEQRARFARLKLIGVISVGLAAVAGAAVGWLVSPEFGVAAFVALAVALGLIMHLLLQTDDDRDQVLEGVEAFRNKLLEGLAAIEAERPTAGDIRALHERLIDEAATAYAAGDGQRLVVRGWAAARPVGEEPPELGRLAPRWRISARRGAVFAVNEHLLVAWGGGRLSVRRIVIDLVRGEHRLLEARELRADAAELWLRPRYDAVGPLGPRAPSYDMVLAPSAERTAPSQDAPKTPAASEPKAAPNPDAAKTAATPQKDTPAPDAPTPEPTPVARRTRPAPPPPPAPPLARREIAIVSAAGATATPAADAVLFDALAEADRAEQSDLKRALAKLQKAAADKSAGKVSGAVELRRRAHIAALEARLAELAADLADFDTQRAAIAEEGALEKLRGALFT